MYRGFLYIFDTMTWTFNSRPLDLWLLSHSQHILHIEQTWENNEFFEPLIGQNAYLKRWHTPSATHPQRPSMQMKQWTVLGKWLSEIIFFFDKNIVAWKTRIRQSVLVSTRKLENRRGHDAATGTKSPN